MPLGKFIIIEGGDCCGKSTFIDYLRKTHLESSNFLFTFEPGGNSDYVMSIRRILLNDKDSEQSDNLTKFFLYWATKAENFKKYIKPFLSKGGIVVSDRFEASTFAYQVSENPRIEKLFWEAREACLENVSPYYIYFDLSPELAISRQKQREGESNYFDHRGLDYRNKVRSFYNRFFQSKPIRHYYRIDASGTLEETMKRALEVFETIIKK